MSLRAELHDALDEVTPAAPHLELRVKDFVLGNARGRMLVLRGRPRVRWTRPFRGAAGLFAAALVVALIGGLIVGGRLLRDLNTPTQPINQAELKRLEARPLQLPVVLPGATCPTSPLTDVSAHGPEALVFGLGPVYSTPLASSYASTNWGTWISLGLQVDTTTATGLILIRGRDVQTQAKVVFAPTPFSGKVQYGDGIPTGRVTGNDVIQGVTAQLYPELVLDTSKPYVGTKKGDWPIFKGLMGYPKSATGCIGFQVDGPSFTELIVVGG